MASIVNDPKAMRALAVRISTEIGRRDPPCDQWFYNNVTGAARVFTSTPGGILAFKSRTTQDSSQSFTFHCLVPKTLTFHESMNSL